MTPCNYIPFETADIDPLKPLSGRHSSISTFCAPRKASSSTFTTTTKPNSLGTLALRQPQHLGGLAMNSARTHEPRSAPNGPATPWPYSPLKPIAATIPIPMHPSDLETAPSATSSATSCIRCPQGMDAAAIHAHALDMFETELAEEGRCDCAPTVEIRRREADPYWLDALLDIKRLAGKSGDHEADPLAGIPSPIRRAQP